jgi:hypothetical protein
MDSEQALLRLLIWFWYFLGVSLHILLKSRASIAASSNSITTFRGWWEHNWQDMGWRLFLDGVGLMLWEVAPHILGSVIGEKIPVTYGTAPIMGFAVDRFVDSSGFIAGFMRVDMPAVAPPKEVQSPDGAAESPRH